MAHELKEVAENILTEALACPHIRLIESSVSKGNTLVECLDFLLRTSGSDIAPLLNSVAEEIFLDIHVTATLAMSNKLKAASVLLRTIIETAVYIIYFVDHPLEARLWAHHGMDMSFSKTLASIADPKYLQAASGRAPVDHAINQIRDRMQSRYRLLSERVHGKFAFLQLTISSPKDDITKFCEATTESFDDLIRIAQHRTQNVEALIAQVPSIARIAQ